MSHPQFECLSVFEVPSKMQIKKKKMNGKDVPVHFMKAYRRNRGIVPVILNLGTK
jgi:hypothetical protein